MQSMFNTCDSSSITFKSLPEPAKKAIVWRWAIECYNPPFERIEDYIPHDLHGPESIDKTQWQSILSIAEEEFADRVFRYNEIDVDKVKNAILTKCEDIAEEQYKTWQEYSDIYGLVGIPRHPDSNRWPCLSPLGDFDTGIEDGWHRLHSYINSNHTTIPILEY